MSRNKFGNRISHREENNMRIFLLKEKRYINIKNTFLKKHNVFAEEIDKIAWASHDDKKLQSIDFDRNICIQNEQRSNIKKEEIKCCNIIKLYKKFKCGYITEECKKQHESKLARSSWLFIQNIIIWRFWICKNKCTA